MVLGPRVFDLKPKPPSPESLAQSPKAQDPRPKAQDQTPKPKAHILLILPGAVLIYVEHVWQPELKQADFWHFGREFMTRSTVLPGPKILLIEDYSDTRELLSILLRKKGYNVIEAEDGIEGLLKAGLSEPDLILMDLALPEMDGIEAARRIREVPKLSHVPIFVLSAYLTEDVEEDIRAIGCMEMFGKPFDFESLLESINLTLGLPTT